MSKRALWGLVIFSLVIMMGCEEDEEPTSPQNNPPEILNITANPSQITPDGTSVISCEAADEDGDPLTYEWNCQFGSFPNGDTMSTVTWQAPGDTGNYALNIQVSDGAEVVEGYLFVNVVLDNSVIIIYSDKATLTAGDADSANIGAILRDVNGQPIVGDTIHFSADPDWLLIESLKITDSTGTAMTTLDDAGLEYYTYPDSAMIIANYELLGLADTLYITIMPPPIVSLFIYSDRNVLTAGVADYATIGAILRDADNQPIIGDTILFSVYPVWFIIESPKVTDSTGTALTIFDDLGPAYYTYPDSARVVASYEPLGAADTLYITVLPPPIIDHITLTSPGSAGMVGNGIDTTTVTARVFLEGGDYAPAGTAVHFYTTLGTLIPSDTVVQSGGIAIAKFVSAVSLDTAFITAESGGVISNELSIPFFPGSPTDIVLVCIYPPNLIVDGPPAAITVAVLDAVGHGVPNQQVSWSATLGMITSLSLTDNLGYAAAYLSPQLESGTAVVSASTPSIADTLFFGVIIYPDLPYSIDLSSDVDQISVQGLGGQESAFLTAEVFDNYGNPVQDNIMVVFELMSSIPEGTAFDNGLSIDSSFIYEGEAIAVMNSGTEPGNAQVRATTWRDWPSQNEPIISQNLNITILGPPAAIIINVSGEPYVAEPNPFGANLKFETSALVLDENGIGLEGVEVTFSLGPEDSSLWTQWYNPNSAYPALDVITDSSGVAYGHIYYNSEYTFNMLDIIARCESQGDTIEDIEEEVVLPLYEGQLYLDVTPFSYAFTNPYDVCVMRVRTTLRDGLNNRINNAFILFSNDLGLYFFADSVIAASLPLPYNWIQMDICRFEMYTGPNPPDSINYQLPNFNQDDGEAILFMRAEEVTNIYCNPPYPGVFIDPFTMIVACEIEAMVVGTGICSDPEIVMFSRSAE
ncbi:MAG: hypothetical protein HQ591_12560 [candidate division Zixibacteria bacterium]|nr:hypothetical protein [Candidatus Tariuqbacter arcticus]